MADRPVQLDWIDGAWHSPAGTLEGFLEDPTTGERLAPQAATSSDGLEAALAAAQRAHEAGTWAATPPEGKAEALDALAAELEGRAGSVAALESAQTGVPVWFMGMVVGAILPGAFRLAAQGLRDGWASTSFAGSGAGASDVEVHRLPWGVALSLVPWNAPAPMAAHKVASSLAAGCPSILKASEFAPLGCASLAAAAEAVGLPGGLLQLVHGGPAQGGKLVTDPRVRAVSFTGGLSGGRAIAAACAPEFKPAQLELGGNNALVVMPDAAVDEVVGHAVALLTTLNGQWCRALGRLILPAARHDEIVAAIVGALASVAIGDPMAEGVAMGPIVHSAHRRHLQARIDELVAGGGEAHAPATLPDGKGNWLSPTLVTGVASDAALTEIFGPVATVHPYSSLEEAVALANATPYGLEGYVVGADTAAALAVARRVRAGGVKVNGSTVMSLHLMAPRPAWGLSGFAEEGTFETYRFFCGTRVVGVEGALS